MPLDNPFGQLVVALVTPLTTSGELCWPDLERHVEAVVQGGADALVVASTTGESAALADAEKIELVRAVSQVASGRAAVVAATGTSDTARSIELSRACAAAGADGVLLVTPYYSRPTQSALLAHLWAVSDATDLPVMLYDIPARTGVGLELDTLARAARHPNICAIKDATGNLGRAARLIEGGDLLYFAGDDALALPALAIGATGLVGVSANVAPLAYRQLLDAVADGDLPRATDLHRLLAPLVGALMDHIPAAVSTKMVLHALGRLSSPRVRLPHTGPERDELEAIRCDLARVRGVVGVEVSPMRMRHEDVRGGALAPAERR